MDESPDFVVVGGFKITCRSFSMIETGTFPRMISSGSTSQTWTCALQTGKSNGRPPEMALLSSVPFTRQIRIQQRQISEGISKATVEITAPGSTRTNCSCAPRRVRSDNAGCFSPVNSGPTTTRTFRADETDGTVKVTDPLLSIAALVTKWPVSVKA
jgi:hypothetical protein